MRMVPHSTHLWCPAFLSCGAQCSWWKHKWSIANMVFLWSLSMLFHNPCYIFFFFMSSAIDCDNLDCSEFSEPVCGSNDQTYMTECALQSAACTNDGLTVKHRGPCRKFFTKCVCNEKFFFPKNGSFWCIPSFCRKQSFSPCEHFSWIANTVIPDRIHLNWQWTHFMWYILLRCLHYHTAFTAEISFHISESRYQSLSGQAKRYNLITAQCRPRKVSDPLRLI